MRGAVEDKLLADLAGMPVLLRSIRAFVETKAFSRFIFVCRDDDQETAIRALVDGMELVDVAFTRGGVERADSVRAGLAVLSADAAYVAIHDGARPLITSGTILAALELTRADGAVVVGRRVTDTIKRIPADGSTAQVVLEDLDRSRIWAMETPQIFRRELIEEGYSDRSVLLTDDAAAVARLGHGVTIFENEYPNPKITRPEDLAWAAHLLDSAKI